MKRNYRVIAAASLVLVAASLAVGCSKSDKATNPATGSGPLSSGDLANGAVFQFRFMSPGAFNYHCARHPTTMKGSVTVSSTAPAGDSLMSVSITDFAFTAKDITIPVGGKVTWTNNSGGIVHTVTSD